MEAAALVTKAKRKQQSEPEPNSAGGHGHRAAAGLPLFLQRCAVVPAPLQRQEEASAEELEEESQETGPLQAKSLSALPPPAQRQEEAGEEPEEEPPEGFVQAKLTVGRPGDVYEQEADQVAATVMRRPESSASPSAGPLPGAPSHAAVSTITPPDTGIPLARRVRQRVEPVLGADLSAVRVHTSPAAQATARGLRAKAFTHRNHIWLGPSQSPDDLALMAHEATHVVQQGRGGGVARPALQRRPQPAAPRAAARPGSLGPGSQSEDPHERQFDRYFALAKRLWGEQSRKYPQLIPIPSEGRDLLIWGSPERQMVLNLLARALMDWAKDNYGKPSFLAASPEAVASFLLKYGGLGEMLAWAGGQPLASESIDRNSILWGTTATSFGGAVLQGLLLIGLVGVAVGAGLPVIAATGLLVGLAGHQGVKSYLARRDEIERQGYEVPIPETALAAAGDVVGLSQLIEGLSGQQLGTGAALGSVRRSQQLGTGTGATVAILMGSRAYRTGQSVGRAWRLSQPPGRPATPYGSATPTPKALGEAPAVPPRDVHPGPVEAGLRSRLPDESQLGLDLFIERLRAQGKNPEVDLARIPEAVLRQLAERQATRYRETVTIHQRVGQMSGRDPLRPNLRNREWRDNIEVQFDKKPPSPAEIAAGKELASATGEHVRLFGDLPAGVDYPGIDGTIGLPPRPLSQKSAAPEWARWHAQKALKDAQGHGYTAVTVQIRIRGTLAEALAHWNSVPRGQLGPYFRRGIIREVLLMADDGGMSMFPSLGPPLVPPHVKVPERSSED